MPSLKVNNEPGYEGLVKRKSGCNASDFDCGRSPCDSANFKSIDLSISPNLKVVAELRIQCATQIGFECRGDLVSGHGPLPRFVVESVLVGTARCNRIQGEDERFRRTPAMLSKLPCDT